MSDNSVSVFKVDPVHTDDRGSIIDVLNEQIGHVGVVEFTKGAVRGRHYHVESTQYDYILSGKLLLVVCDKDGSNREDHELSVGMGTKIMPGKVHTYVALENSKMLDLTTLGRAGDNYEQDTVRVELPFEL